MAKTYISDISHYLNDIGLLSPTCQRRLTGWPCSCLRSSKP